MEDNVTQVVFLDGSFTRLTRCTLHEAFEAISWIPNTSVGGVLILVRYVSSSRGAMVVAGMKAPTQESLTTTRSRKNNKNKAIHHFVYLCLPLLCSSHILIKKGLKMGFIYIPTIFMYQVPDFNT